MRRNSVFCKSANRDTLEEHQKNNIAFFYLHFLGKSQNKDILDNLSVCARMNYIFVTMARAVRVDKDLA